MNFTLQTLEIEKQEINQNSKNHYLKPVISSTTWMNQCTKIQSYNKILRVFYSMIEMYANDRSECRIKMGVAGKYIRQLSLSGLGTIGKTRKKCNGTYILGHDQHR